MANKNLIINLEEHSLEFKAIGLILCIAQEINSKMNRVLKPLGLSSTQAAILHCLSDSPNGELTVNQIRKLMIEDNPNVSRSLNKLQSNKFVVKRRSKDDQRVVFIKITKTGKALIKEAEILLAPILRINASGKESEALFNILKKI